MFEEIISEHESSFRQRCNRTYIAMAVRLMFEEIISELAESGIELDRPAMAYLDYGAVHGIVSLVDPKNDKNNWTWTLTLADITERAQLPLKDLRSANISFEEKEPDKDLDTLILTVAK